MHIEHTLILLTEKTATREGHAQRQVLWIAIGSTSQLWNGDKVVFESEMGYAVQDCQALIAGVFFDFRGKHLDGARKLGSLEQGETKVHLQTRQVWIDGDGLPVELDGLLQPLLPRLQQPKVR